MFTVDVKKQHVQSHGAKPYRILAVKYRTLVVIFELQWILFVKFRRKFPQKKQKGRQKSLCKKVYKSGGTNTVLKHAFPSKLISQRCFLRIWGETKCILMDRKTATSWKTNKILSFT